MGAGVQIPARAAARQGVGASLLATAAVFLLAAPAHAQQVTCTDPPFTGPFAPNQTCTVSQTSATVSVDVFLPGSTVTAPDQPVLSAQLQSAIAAPNGSAIHTTLTNLGVLGLASAPTLVRTRIVSQISTSNEVTPGPGVLLIGPDQLQTFFVPSGTVNTNINTHTDTFINPYFQASQALTSRGVNFLLGDLHTTFQSVLIDDGLRFLDVLLGRGSDANAGATTFTPLGFAAEAVSAAPFESALAYATKSPRMLAAPLPSEGWRAWLRGSGTAARYDGTLANFGFKAHTGSVEGGIERVSGAWLVGGAFGFGTAKIDQDTTGDSGKIETIRGGFYAAYRPGDWSLTSAVAFGISEIGATRLSLFPALATASYDATTLLAGFEVVRHIMLGAVKFEPLAGLAYTGLRVDAFRESGTTFLDLAGERASIDALKGYVGGRLSTTWGAITPELRGRVLYDVLDDPRGFTARFIADPAATPIPVTGIQPDRFAGMVGGSLTARLSPGWRAYASYDAELRSNTLTHIGAAGLKVSW